MTDEQLVECSPAATGVFIRIMCILHKQRPYGTILLKQKDKQMTKQIENFAYKFVKQLPWDYDVILAAITELVQEGCLKIEGDMMYQKRMKEDGELSDQRSFAGKKGVEAKKNFAEAKPKANTDIENEDELLYPKSNISGKFSDFNLIMSDAMRQSCLEILSRAQFGTDKKVTGEHVDNLFIQFCETYKDSVEIYRSEHDVWLHFKRWLPKQRINGRKSTIASRNQEGFDALVDKGKRKFAEAREKNN